MTIKEIITKSNNVSKPETVHIVIDHILYLRCFDMIKERPASIRPYCIEINFLWNIKPLVCFFLTESHRDSYFNKILKDIKKEGKGINIYK